MRRFLLVHGALAVVLGLLLAGSDSAIAGPFRGRHDRPALARRVGEGLRIILPPYGRRARARSCCD